VVSGRAGKPLSMARELWAATSAVHLVVHLAEQPLDAATHGVWVVDVDLQWQAGLG
jgi:hypothetical protein